MTIYFVLLLVVTMAIYLAQRVTTKVEKLIMYAAAFAFLVSFSGLRSMAVGTDAAGYVAYGQRLAMAERPGVPELGFTLLMQLTRPVADDYAALFTLVAIVTTSCFLLGIRSLSFDPAMSVFVLLTSGAYFFSFNGLRQGLAIAMLFPAIGFVYYRKFWAFLVCVAVASMFHISAVMFLPTYFIVPRKNGFRYNVMVFGTVVVSVLFFSELVALAGRLNPRYLVYGEVGRLSSGLAYAASVVAIGLFFLFFKKYVRQHRPWYDLLLNLYLLGIVVTVVAVFRTTFVSGVMRMNAYFITSQILLWPIVFVNLHRSRQRVLVGFAFVILFLVYHGILLSRFSDLVPYSFNPLVRTWFPTF